MKKFLSLILVALISLFMPVTTYAEIQKSSVEKNISKKQIQTNNKITINSGTLIPVIFAYPVNSQSVSKGDMLPITVDKDILVNDILVFKKGSQGIAFIEEVKHARAWGRPGMIQIQTGKLADVFGNEHTINLSYQAKGNSSKAAIILPIVAMIIVWPLVFFAFRKGEEISIPAGKIFNAFTTTPVIVKG